MVVVRRRRLRRCRAMSGSDVATPLAEMDWPTDRVPVGNRAALAARGTWAQGSGTGFGAAFSTGWR